MGIKGLSKLLADQAPGVLRDSDIKSHFGRTVAIDISTFLYQFMVAVRSEGQMLTDASGATTSHIVGLFYRTIRMLEAGIKPVYVFDGKPPTLKSGELAKRGERRREAVEAAAAAVETGDAATAEKMAKRTVKVTSDHNDDARRLLSLMGVPFVEAPCEAEATCAHLASSGVVFAAGSEDMDTLTFGAPVMLRHLTYSEARQMPIVEIRGPAMLTALGMTREQFVDLCILLGCDYCSSIPGIGPKKAIALLREHGSLEEIVKAIDKKAHPIPEDWPYKEARELFLHPNVADVSGISLKWSDPDEDGLIQFMVHEKNFSEDRVRNGVRKILASKAAASQTRLDMFFKPAASSISSNKSTISSKAVAGKKVAKKPMGRPRR